MTSWGECSARQQVTLETFAELVSEVPEWVTAERGRRLSSESQAALGLCVGKLAQHLSCLVRSSGRSCLRLVGRQCPGTLLEVNPFGGSVGDWMQIVETSARLTGLLSRTARPLLLSKVMLAEGVGLEAVFGCDRPVFLCHWLRKPLRLFLPLDSSCAPMCVACPRRSLPLRLVATYRRAYASREQGGGEGLFSLRYHQELIRREPSDLPLLIVYAYRRSQE